MSAPNPPLVLVVDDDPVCRLLATETLAALGYQARSASPSDDLISLCRHLTPVAVQMDVEMGGADERDVTRRLRALQSTSRLGPFAIVGTTGLNNPEEVGSCADAGMDACLGKPIEMVRLATELSRLTGRAPLGAALPFGRTSLEDEV